MKIFSIPVCVSLLLLSISCDRGKNENPYESALFPPEPSPKGYVCYRTESPLIIDGVADEPGWSNAEWTGHFVDIEGDIKTAPAHATRVKMLWDTTYLYVTAEITEPHIQATLRQRDTVIFYDNDFEIFIDPDQDTHAYYEFEFNAFGTAWDLLLLKPYRDGGPAVNGWDAAGMKAATKINGTINNPSDTDEGWTIEVAIPLAALKECNGGRMPAGGDQWRINFSRVEWRTLAENGRYVKEINPQTGKPFPESNWVWSPQGRINMHMPEMWGYIQFSDTIAGDSSEAFIPDSNKDLRWGLRMIYYAASLYYQEHGSYTDNIEDLGLSASDFPGKKVPEIRATKNTYESYFPGTDLVIYNDGKITSIAK